MMSQIRRVWLLAAVSLVVHVGCGSVPAKSDAGNVEDDDANSDTTPPTVIGTMPSDQATNVDYRVNLAITFSEPVAAATATLLTSPDAGCAPELDSTGTRLSCNNSVDLQPSTSYVVTVPSSVTDIAGNPLATEFTFQFVTSAEPDTTPPTITQATPSDGSIGSPLRPTIAVVFSEPMNQSSVESAFAFVAPSGANATYSWSADGQTLTVTPTTDFSYGQQVVWQLGAGSTDLAGNAISAQQFTFRVRRITTTSLTPVDFAHTLDGVAGAGLWVGDNATNKAYRSFFVYSLPSDALEVQSASFTVMQSISSYNPFSIGTMIALAMYVESVPYTAPIDNGEAVAPPACLGTPTECAAAHSRCLDAEVLSSSESSGNAEPRSVATAKFIQLVRSGLSEPGRTFAIRVRRGYLSNNTSAPCGDYFTDGDNAGDYVRYFDSNDTTVSNRPKLTITYTYP
jgi:hypothetical protein